jgi:hypothetical protein
MQGALAAAALAFLGVLAGAEGGGKGGAAPPPAASSSDLATVKSDKGTWEFQAPTGFSDVPSKKSDIVLQIRYTGLPYLSSMVKVYVYDAYKDPAHLEHFMKMMEKSIGGNITYEGDMKNRFASDLQFSGTWWISQVEGRIEKGNGAYAIECLVPKDVYEETKEVWAAVADSFKTFPPPPDAYAVPLGWKENKNAMFSVMGPMSDLKDKKARDLLERRLAQVQTFLDVDQQVTKLYRTVFNDERKAFSRCPIHVQPTSEGFKAEAGDRWVEGARVLYLPDHPERILLLDGSAENGFRDDELQVEAGIQYAETRIPRMWPWMRAAFRLYFRNAIAKGFTPGLFPPETLKRAKEVFNKTPAAFDDLMKKDEAGMAALGDDGRVAAWGLLQFGLHGPDAATRSVFRALLRDGIGAPDLNAVWEKCLARHKEETKKVYRTKDLDAGARKFFRDMKEEKK